MAIIDTLPALTTPTTGDELPIERGTTVYKVDYSALKSQINSGMFGPNSLGTITNANNTSLYGSGFFQASDVSHLPTASSGVYYELVCMGTCQMAYRHSSSGIDAVFARYYTNSQWYSWVRIDGLNKVSLSDVVLASDTKAFGTLNAGATSNASITFSSVGTTNYIVLTEPLSALVTVGIQSKTATSFSMYVRNSGTTDATATVKWAIIALP